MFEVIFAVALAANCFAHPQGRSYSSRRSTSHRVASASPFLPARTPNGVHFGLTDSHSREDDSDELILVGRGPRFGGSGFGRGSREEGDSYYGDGTSSPRGAFQVVKILRDERKGHGDGSYSFAFESADGVLREESGTPAGPGGSVIQRGYWSFTFPDGSPATLSFVADGFGFRPESPLLPLPPPMPTHALAQIEKAERERAAGITHDGQYRHEDHLGAPVRRIQGLTAVFDDDDDDEDDDFPRRGFRQPSHTFQSGGRGSLPRGVSLFAQAGSPPAQTQTYYAN